MSVDWCGGPTKDIPSGMGAILAQMDENGDYRVIRYASKTCTDAARTLTPYFGEMWATVWALHRFARYLRFSTVLVHSDHQPLAYLMNSTVLTGVAATWRLSLAEFRIIHFNYHPG